MTSYAYDADNRRTMTTEAVGTAVQRTSTVAYDKVGNVTSTTDALTRRTTFAYDVLNRQTTLTDWRSAASSPPPTMPSGT